MKQKTLILLTLLSILCISSISFSISFAQNASNYEDSAVTILPTKDIAENDSNSCTDSFKYKSLVTIPGLTDADGTVTICKSSLGTFLQTVFNYIIGIAILLTVVMIIYGGVQYATTDAIAAKGEGKKTIIGALQGLALALGSVLLLSTINPDLVKFDLSIVPLKLRSSTTGGTGSVTALEVVQNGQPISNNNIPIPSPRQSLTKVAFVKKYYEAAKIAGERYNMSPVMILAQAGHESAWGSSKNASYNNFFGFTGRIGSSNQYWSGATRTSTPPGTRPLTMRVYSSPENSFLDFARLISEKYKLTSESYNFPLYSQRISQSAYICECNGDNRSVYNRSLLQNAVNVQKIISDNNLR
jgi:peptidoglycan hydrolase FlgJ